MCAKKDRESLNAQEETSCSIIRNVSAILFGIVKFIGPDNINNVKKNSMPKLVTATVGDDEEVEKENKVRKKLFEEDIVAMIKAANACASVLIDLIKDLIDLGADIELETVERPSNNVTFGRNSTEIYDLMSAAPILTKLFELGRANMANPYLKAKLVKLQAQVQVQIKKGGKKIGTKGKSQSKCRKIYIKSVKIHIGRDGTSRTIYKNGGLEYVKRKAPDGTFIYVRLRK
jgi:hypothetical protein